MAKRTIALIIFLFLLAAMLLYFAYSLSQKKPQTASIELSPTPVLENAQSVLALSPNNYQMASSSGSLNAVIDTGENNVTAVQMEIAFDPKAITITKIAPGDFFDNPNVLLNDIDTKNGIISYAIALPPTAAAKKGSGVVATIEFTSSLYPGQRTEINFLPKSLITAENISKSVLKTASGAAIIIVPQNVKPSP